jgi:hypothetical protein
LRTTGPAGLEGDSSGAGSLQDAAAASPSHRRIRRIARPPASSPVRPGGARESVAAMTQRDIDQLIMHIKRRVVAREIARRAGADPRELDARGDEIALLRSRLAERVRRTLSGDVAGASVRGRREGGATPDPSEMRT